MNICHDIQRTAADKNGKAPENGDNNPSEMEEYTMKRNAILMTLLLLALVLTACGKSVFSMTENTEKRMTITAEKAEKDAFFMVGTLVIDNGEQIDITSNLSEGEVRVEIVSVPEGQNADKLPGLSGEPIITANVQRTDGASGTVPAGDYSVRATCMKKATGTITIEVKTVE